MKKIYFIFLITILWTTGISAQQIYHVSKSGDNNNLGDESNPFLTISKAASLVQAGDQVIIHEGVYEETVTPNNSGTAGSPIVFKGAAGEKVIVTAMQEVNGWTLHEGSIYKATVDWSLGQNNFVMNGSDACQLARWPNKTDKDPFVLNSLRNTGGTDGSVITNARLDYSPGILNIDWSKGGYLFYYCNKGGSGWSSWRAWIKSNTSTSVTFDLPNNPSWLGGSHLPSWLGDFFLVGAKEALDYANEWYLDDTNDILYLQTPNGEAPADGQIMMRKRKVCINLKDRSYIEIRNLAVFGGSIEINGSASHNLISGISSYYGNYTEGVINNFTANEQSINIGGSYNVIENSEIAFGAASGIRDGGNYNTITNCSIHDFDFLGNYDCPVNLRNGSHTTLTHNTIYNGGRDCIQMFNNYSEVGYNNVYRSNLIADDCGLIYTVGGPRNVEIHHNWFHDTQSRGALYKAAGIYLDNDASAFKVHHNVVNNTEWTNIQINWSGTDIDIFNNTLWNGSAVMGAWHKDGTAFSNVKVWNNISNSSAWEPQSDKQNNLTITGTNPFTDMANGDFTLKAGSQPIDAGRVIAGITDGYVGAAPDAGAFEFGATAWKPGIDWSEEDGPLGMGCYGLPGDYCSVHPDLSAMDTDGDGVTDDIDECPNSLPGETVDEKGCYKDLSIQELSDVNMKLYPNPSSEDYIILENNNISTDFTYELIGLSGRVVKQGKVFGEAKSKIDISGLSAGYYFVLIKTKDLVAGTKLIKL